MRFSVSGPLSAIAMTAVLTLGAGCSSTTEDPGTGAVNTGAYPNLNIKPGVAAEQITPEERAAKGQELKQAQAAAVRSGGSPPANRLSELRALNQTHAKKTLEQIEKGDCSPRPSCD